MSPDPTSVWPRIAPIREAWIGTDDQALVVGGLHGFDTVLHSLDVDESDHEVGVTARIAFTQDAARRRAKASEQMGEATVGIGWSANVRLQNPLAGRKVIDRGVVQLELLRSEQSSPLHGLVIAHLEAELAATRGPAERRPSTRRPSETPTSPRSQAVNTAHPSDDQGDSPQPRQGGRMD